jgi:hypothetical protein
VLAVLWSILGVVSALLAYRESERFSRAHGVTPWRVPSLAWAWLGLVGLVAAGLLLAVARRSTEPLVGPDSEQAGWEPAAPAVFPVPGWRRWEGGPEGPYRGWASQAAGLPARCDENAPVPEPSHS